MLDFRDSLLKQLYMVDYIMPRLSAAQSVVLNQLFSRTILVGVETVQISHADMSRLTGLALVTTQRALRSLANDNLITIVGAYRPRVANEYRVNIHIPTELSIHLTGQRDPYIVLTSMLGDTQAAEENKLLLELTAEGAAVIDAILQSMTKMESDRYRREAMDALFTEGKRPTETLIAQKVTELLLQSFSDEKQRRYIQGKA